MSLRSRLWDSQVLDFLRTHMADASALATPAAMRATSAISTAFFALVMFGATYIATDSVSHRVTIRVLAGVSALASVALVAWGGRLPRRAYHLVVAFDAVLVTTFLLLANSTPLTEASGTLYLFVLIAAVIYFPWRGTLVQVAFCAVLAVSTQHHLHIATGSITVRVIGSLIVTGLVAWLARASSAVKYDQLTNVMGRDAIAATLDEAMASASASGNDLVVATLVLDNLQTSHRFRDRLIRSVATVWEQCLGDRGIIGRTGNTHFGIIVRGMTTAQVADLCDELLDLLPEGVTASAGVAAWQPRDTIMTLTGRSDIAIHDASVAGGGVTVVFGDPGRSAGQLEAAIVRGELFLEFQAAITLSTYDVRSFEALVRWRHPTKGLIAPLSFIPQAERTGAIHAVGAWTLDETCRIIASSGDVGEESLRVAVNASVPELLNPGYVGIVAEALSRHRVRPDLLAIEITEAIFDVDQEQILKTLVDLRDLGVRVAIDDFGTGYSSLRWLDHYPVDILKIDQAFVASIVRLDQATPVLEGIIGIAGKLDLTVIVEGIETEIQARHVERFAAAYAPGRFLAQGYYYARPSPSADGQLPRVMLPV